MIVQVVDVQSVSYDFLCLWSGGRFWWTCRVCLNKLMISCDLGQVGGEGVHQILGTVQSVLKQADR